LISRGHCILSSPDRLNSKNRIACCTRASLISLKCTITKRRLFILRARRGRDDRDEPRQEWRGRAERLLTDQRWPRWRRLGSVSPTKTNSAIGSTGSGLARPATVRFPRAGRSRVGPDRWLNFFGVGNLGHATHATITITPNARMRKHRMVATTATRRL